ncbi:leucine-rich repeat domain-containing protein [Aquimarina sp. W85]|uniref:leucine-rich repeat domain-containing protein n=1 Tax=Aquimarina rhodophyticola TaxID=3342246 RepID=UPI00366C6F79
MGNIFNRKDEALENAKKYVHQVARENGKELIFTEDYFDNQTKKLNDKSLISLIKYINKKIPDLKVLSLECLSEITKIPEEIGELHQVQRLIIKENPKLTTITETIFNLSNLEFLDLNDNELKRLPETIGNLDKLKELYIGRNKIENLPSSIGDLSNLEILYLNGNELKRLPETIGKLDNLKNFKLVFNKIENLPSSIGDLSNLEILDLSSNSLATLPETIGNLNKLINFELGANFLQALPDTIGSLTNLEYLGLNFNELTVLPESISGLNNLNMIGVRGNPLSEESMVWLRWLENASSILNVIMSNQISNKNYIAETLVILYPQEEERNRIKEALERLYSNNTTSNYINGVGNELLNKQVINEFLQKASSGGKGELQEIYNTVAKSLLDKVLGSDQNVRELTLQAMATSLGNCATPVKSFLIQYYLYNNNQNNVINSTIMNTLIEREALEEKIRTIINQQSTDGEFIEKINGLINLIYDKKTIENQKYDVPILQEGGRQTYLESKSAYPEYANRRATENEDEIKIFARICCKTDDQNNLIAGEDGKYIVDTIKLKNIAESYCQSQGIATPIGRCLDDFERDFLNYITKDELSQTIAADFYDNIEAMKTLNIEMLKDSLMRKLVKVTTDDYNTVMDTFKREAKQSIQVFSYLDNTKNSTQSTMHSPSNSTPSTKRRSRRRSRGM